MNKNNVLCALLSFVTYTPVVLPSRETPFLPSRFDSQSQTPLTDFVIATMTHFDPEHYITDRFCSKKCKDERSSYPGGAYSGLAFKGTVQPSKADNTVKIGADIAIVADEGRDFVKLIGDHHSEIRVIQEDAFTRCYRAEARKAFFNFLEQPIEYHCVSSVPAAIFLAKVKEIIKQNQEKKAANSDDSDVR